MMDWVRLLDENNIHYVTRGPNTKKGEVSIKCPMCGENDPSEHLGINLQTGKWGCHRDGSHRGKSPRTLVKAILGCSSQQAGHIVRQYNHSDPDSLEAALSVLEADIKGVIHHEDDLIKQVKHQRLGPQFNDFNKIKVRGLTRRFFDYIKDRGYENPQDVVEYYDLRCAFTGAYKDRIIIPIKLNNELLGWTSRALGSPKNAPRYLASSEDVKTTVFNYDDLKNGGDRLFVVEGPFDAIKIDSFGLQNFSFTNIDIRATCTFGTSVAISQIALLRVLVKRFKETWVLFDRGAESSANELATWLGCRVALLPNYLDDPGELTNVELELLTEKCYDGYCDARGGLAELIRSSSVRTRTKQLAKNLTQSNVLLTRLKRKP